MNGKGMSLVIVLALLVLVGSATIYRITELERGVLLRFGEIVQEDLQPGLHIKIPLVDEVRRFDARVLTVDSVPERFFTAEQEQLIVDSYAKFRVSNVGNYYRVTGGDETVARQRLTARINDGLRNEFSSRTLQEVVSGERDQLMDQLTRDLNESMSEVLGVEVLDVRVQRIDLPDEISGAIYNRMRSDREKEARQARSEGLEEAEKIRADADRQQVLIEAEAYRQAEEIRGEGDAQAAAIYAESYGANTEFYSFLRSLQAYGNTFGGGGDIMLLEPNSDFFRYLKNSGGAQ
jgi:modulator of FtsH protease HflC